MNLHRTGKTPQWEEVRPSDRNLYQRLAARTGGVLTPGNVVSAAGAALVFSGLRDAARGKIGKSIMKIGAGRIADLVDGFGADRTGTKSPFGEAMDIGVDKVEAAVTLPVLTRVGVLPEVAAGLIAASNLTNAALTVVAKRRSAEIHPSRAGKLTMLAQWTAIGLYGFAALARENAAPEAARNLELAGGLGTMAFGALAARAAEGYARDALGSGSGDA